MKKLNFSIKNVVMYGFVLGFALISINTSFVNAQSDAPYTVLAPLPCIESPATENNPGVKCPNGNGALQPTVNFQNYVQYTVNLLIGLSAVVAVVMIIWNGIEYMYSASFSNKNMSLQKAKDAVVGLVLIFTSYIILRTIDPRLVQIPNSLVPQIEVVSYLDNDAIGLLTNTVLNDIERTKIKGQEIAKAQSELVNQVAAKQEEFLDLKDKILEIDALDPEATDPELQKRRKELIVQQLKIQEETKLLTIKREIESAKNAFNGLIRSSLSDAIANIEMDVPTQIQQMNINKDNVEKIRKLKKEAITKLGEVNFKPLDEEAKYAKYVIDKNKLKLIIINTREVARNDTRDLSQVSKMNYVLTFDTEGAPKSIYSDGSKTAKQLASEYIQLEIAKIIKTQTTLTIPELKDRLQVEIDDLKLQFDKNKVLNPDKK